MNLLNVSRETPIIDVLRALVSQFRTQWKCPSIETAKSERDAAIKAVTDKAVANGWDKEHAYDFLVCYAKHNMKFFAWDMRSLYEAAYKKPHDARAWGQIYRRAVKEGIIRRGTEERADPTRHATMTKCWEVI